MPITARYTYRHHRVPWIVSTVLMIAGPVLMVAWWPYMDLVHLLPCLIFSAGTSLHVAMQRAEAKQWRSMLEDGVAEKIGVALVTEYKPRLKVGVDKRPSPSADLQAAIDDV